MSQTRRLAERIALCVVYAAIAVYAVFLSAERAYHNWDVVGYIASAKSMESPDIAIVHAFTFDELRRVLPAPLYEDITREKNLGTGMGAVYRHAVSSDPAVLKEQLPYYQIRPVYVALVYVFYKAGVDIEMATHLVSGIAVAAGLLLLGLLASSFLSWPFALVIAALALGFDVMDLARFSTPDGLAFFVIVLMAYLFAKSRYILLCVVAPLAVGVRTDLIVFVLPLSAAMFFFDRSSRIRTIVSALASAAIYIGVVRYYGNPGWSTFFYCATYERCVHPISDPPHLTLQMYLAVLANGTKLLLADPLFVAYVVIVVGTAWLAVAKAKRTSALTALASPPCVLAMVCLADIACRFLALPSQWERFYTAPYIVSAFAWFWLINDRFDSMRGDGTGQAERSS